MKRELMRRLLLGCTLLICGLQTACGIANGPTSSIALDATRKDTHPGDPQRVFVLVELESRSTTEIYASIRKNSQDENRISQARLAAIQHLGMLRQQQETFAQHLQRQEYPLTAELFRLQRVFNGIALRTTISNLGALWELPGVKTIHFLTPQVLHHHHSVPLIGAYQFWESQNLYGEGIKVGIIDTGIDYLHADFDGPGTPEAYKNQDFSIIEDNTFPTNIVAGGWDFAGTYYDAVNPSFDVPAPDPDPLDNHGHGTHVAGSVGGIGVLKDGSSYAGPYDMSLDPQQFEIAPGVAPKVRLFALKVFGDGSGSTVLSPMAIEWALDPNADGDFSDRLDVVNLSLGEPYGSGSANAIIYNNASKGGLIIVASAGNSGDSYFITGAPSQAESAISVAASGHDGMVSPAIKVEPGSSVAQGLYDAGLAVFGPQEWDPVNGSFTVPLVVQGDEDNSDDPMGCTAFQGTDFSNSIALIDRGACTFTTKVKNAQEAGAKAVVIANNKPSEGVINMAGEDPTITIPTLMVSYELGQAIKTALAIPETVMVALDLTHQNAHPELVDTIASFSSRGPVHDGPKIRLKPDITAPGVDIMSADTLTGTLGVAYGGTSMASPHVAGVMALLRELHPDWTPQQLKALVMNTAINDVTIDVKGGTPVGLGRTGAGRVDLNQAVGTEVIAYASDAPKAVTVSFAMLDVVGSMTETREVTINNLGDEALTYDISIDPRSDVVGATFEVANPDPVSLEAGATANISVVLKADSASMSRGLDPGLEIVTPRYSLSEEAAYLVLTPQTGGQTIRVPLYAVLRPAADILADTPTLSLDGANQVEMALSGETTENLPSLVSHFELKFASPAGDQFLGWEEQLPDGWDISQAASGDLKYVGVTSDLKEILAILGPENKEAAWEFGTLYFGLVTHGLHGSPMEVGFYVLIDVDQDLQYDFVLTLDRYGDEAGSYQDFFVAKLLDRDLNLVSQSALNGILPEIGFDGVPFVPVFMNDAVVLPVSLLDLGLTSHNAKISFCVQLVHDPLVDLSPWFEFDPAKSGIDFDTAIDLEGNLPSYPTVHDQDDTVVNAKVDLAAASLDRTGGVLLIHHHNQAGKRGELIKVAGLSCTCDEDCPQDDPFRRYCDTLTGVCVGCSDSSQCFQGGSCGRLRICEHACAAQDANACPGGSFCDLLSGHCVGNCADPLASDCPAGTHCDVASGSCLQPSSLVTTTELVVGDTNCPEGGKKIEIGLDLDDDGILDPHEVETTQFICHDSSDPGEDELGFGCSASGHGSQSLLLLLLLGLPVLRKRKE